MSNKSIKIYDFIEQLTYNYWSKTSMGQYATKISIVKLIGYYNILKFVIEILRNSKYYSKYYIKKIPYVKNKITDERQKIIKSIHTKFDKQLINVEQNDLPKIGFNSTKIISLFDNLINKSDVHYRNGRVSGATYSNNTDLDKMLVQVFPYFNKSNPLHTNLYPPVRKMEQECVSIIIKLFNGNSDTCGSFTSGGTESILLACKTYRDRALNEFNITNPEMIVSSTVHCAFNKACKYFNIKMVTIPCNEDGYNNVHLFETCINKNTIMLVGSTPNYNLGIIDNIIDLNTIAIKHKIPLHLDACIGAFLINFSKFKFDFSLGGVTSISADFHKYGQSPKGASCVMYKNKDIMKYQYFIDEKWSGGIYASSTFSGSRCGNIVALTWATLMYYGENGYKSNYEHIIKLKDYFIENISKIPDLYIYGKPQLSILAVNSAKLNINVIADELKSKLWEVNVIQNPCGFHFCLTSFHTKEVLDNFFYDLKNIINKLNESNETKNIKYSPCIYGTMEKIDDSDIMNDVITDYLHVVNGAI
jgi:sphinganine-1-phosphate aldolase